MKVGFGIGFWDWVIFPGVQKYRKIRFPIFPGVQKYRKTKISNISRILENVADLVNQIIKYDAIRN